MKIKSLLLPLSATLAVIVAAAPADGAARTPEVPNPSVPAAVSFCGKSVSLDRVDMYERYDRELTALAYGHGNTLLILKRANKYFPVMAPILRQNGIPEDFLYLACVESTLNHRALSAAKAAGFWQFLPATGKQYGLEVTDEVDERYNLEKATAAACRYFKVAYDKYGDWPTVMASFNGGMGRISSELDKQLRTSSMDLYLTEETSRYVFRIMALKAIMENPVAYGFELKADQFYQPMEYTVVEVSEPVEDWPEWALDHGVSYAQLREENPWIRSKKLTNKYNKTYKVKIPLARDLSRKTAKRTLFNPHWVKQ